MTKEKISITLDREIVRHLEKMTHENSGRFRNRSHVIEFSLKKLIDENKKENGEEEK